MRRAFPIASFLTLAACSFGGSTGPLRLADTAVTGMWSHRTPAEVASCIAAVNRTATPEMTGSGYTIPSASVPAVTYTVRDVASGKSVYATQVNVDGTPDRAEETSAAMCLQQQGTPSVG